jgi:hypothetical protein
MRLLDLPALILDRLGAEWFTVKHVIERSFAFHDDALHVIAGVVLQLVLAFVLRSTVSRFAPWLIVLALELANEWGDVRFDLWPEAERSAQVGEGVKDVLLTMALPTLLLLVSRYRPGLFSRGR